MTHQCRFPATWTSTKNDSFIKGSFHFRIVSVLCPCVVNKATEMNIGVYYAATGIFNAAFKASAECGKTPHYFRVLTQSLKVVSASVNRCLKVVYLKWAAFAVAFVAVQQLSRLNHVNIGFYFDATASSGAFTATLLTVQHICSSIPGILDLESEDKVNSFFS